MSSEILLMDITILGRAYQVSCKLEERESLLKAVQLVDGKCASWPKKPAAPASVWR